MINIFCKNESEKYRDVVRSDACTLKRLTK